MGGRLFICSSASGAFSRFGGFSSQRGLASSLKVSLRSGIAALASCTLLTVPLGAGQSGLPFVAVILALMLFSGTARIVINRLAPPRVVVVTREGEIPPPRSTVGTVVRHLPVSAAHIAEPMSLIAEIVAQARNFDACAVEIVGDLGLSGPVRSNLGWELREQHASLRFPVDGVPLSQRRVHCSVQGGQAVLEISAPAQSLGARLAKRTADIVGAALLIIVFSPLLAGLAVTVRTTSRGPALYKQERVGRDGRLFQILKFRSMTNGSDSQLQALLKSQNKDDKPLFKIDNDPRGSPEAGRGLCPQLVVLGGPAHPRPHRQGSRRRRRRPVSA